MAWQIADETEDQVSLVDPQDDTKKITIERKLVNPKAWDMAKKMPRVGQEPTEQSKQQKIFSSLVPQVAANQEKMKAPEAEKEVEQPQVTPIEQAAPIAPAAPAMPSVMQAQTTQTQRTMPGPEYKAAMGAFDKATEEVQKTSMAQANLEIEKQKQIGAEQMRVQQQYEDDLISVESERLMRENAVQKQRDKYNAAVESEKNFEYKDFFEGRTGAKVMAGIAMALGTVGAALTKGENVAYKVIQNAIDQDFAMQKAEHEKLKGTVQESRNLYTQLMRQGLDELQADVAFSEIKYKQSMTKIEAMKSQISDPEGVAKLDALKAKMQQDLAAKQMQATEGFNIKAISESKPMVLPSTKETAQAGREIEEYVAKTPIKEASDAYLGLKEFQAAVKAGASPAAIASFIASNKGLGQGSYGPLFEQMLKDAGLVDRTLEGITAFLTGDKSATLIKSIENFMQAKSIEAGIRARDYLPEFEALNERAGRPRDLYTKQINPAALLRGKAQSAGLRPVGGK